MGEAAEYKTKLAIYFNFSADINVITYMAEITTTVVTYTYWIVWSKLLLRRI